MCVPVNAQINEVQPFWISHNGYIKNIQNTYFIQKIDSNASMNTYHNRLNLKFVVAPKWSGRLEIRNRIFYGEQVKKTVDFGNSINQYDGVFKLSQIWINEQSIIFHSVIDRMLLNYSDNNWEITLGRQRINWGITTIWNPNDIFNAYNFLDFDYEERSGNDALRIQRNLTPNSEIEFAYKQGKNKNEHTAAIRYQFNKWEYDFQFLSGITEADYVFGGGWAGNYKKAGFKGEMSYFLPKSVRLNSYENLSISILAEQTFKNDWYVSIAGLFNSNPANNTNVIEHNFNSTLSAKSLFPYRYSFYAAAIKTISPIMTLNLSTIYAPEKNTLILIPNYSWNIATDFDFDFTAQSFFTNQNNSYPNSITQIYFRIRWSF